MTATQRHQSGYVFKKGKAWYLRYRETVLLEDGSSDHVQKCHRLAQATGQYRTKCSVLGLAEQFLRPLNEGAQTVEGTMTLNQFIETTYLPFVKEQRRMSTYSGYRNMWRRYVLPDGSFVLRDFRTRDGEDMLRAIARRESLSRTTLAHIKAFLSGVFHYARRQGIIDTANPMRDVEVPNGRPPKETEAYTLEQEIRMIQILPEPAATIVAAASFTGVREGELRGLLWENFDGEKIRISTSVWRGQVGEPKSQKSRGAIPVIVQLQALLNRHRASCGNPQTGSIFTNGKGKPINTQALSRNVIRPLLEKAGIPWFGWHAFRRGLATNLYRLGVKDRTIQLILRHANVSTTHLYIKDGIADAAVAMKALEELCATSVQPGAWAN